MRWLPIVIALLMPWLVMHEAKEGAMMTAPAMSLPLHVSGAYEDDKIDVTVTGEWDVDTQRYTLVTTVMNRTDQPLELIANCGSFAWPASFNDDGDYICAAVESMLLERSHQMRAYWTYDELFVGGGGAMAMEYRQDHERMAVMIQLDITE